MLGPAILTWMEQGNQLVRSGITGMGSRGFFQRAGNACQSEIVGTRGSSGGAGPNVIDMKSSFLRDLRQEAILAELPGALADQLHKSGRCVLTHGVGFLPRASLVSASVTGDPPVRSMQWLHVALSAITSR